uniref:Uncharacterized protein n=1 Tax=Oryza sativa subsp. japonica TaxID=39947 RepID=Q6YU37_ORYSJ|nr:hypothetical protein [Oryza sativa Japonica Group]BAD31623.1 hypothetical protein [Oryza sativa Japonica Group]
MRQRGLSSSEATNSAESGASEVGSGRYGDATARVRRLGALWARRQSGCGGGFAGVAAAAGGVSALSRRPGLGGGGGTGVDAAAGGSGRSSSRPPWLPDGGGTPRGCRSRWRRRRLMPWLPLPATRRRSGRAAGTLDGGGVGDLEWWLDLALQVRSQCSQEKRLCKESWRRCVVFLVAGEAQAAEATLSSPGFSFGRTWRGGRRVAGRRWPGPALRGGAVGCSELAVGFCGKFGSRPAEGHRCGLGGSHALPMLVWWFTKLMRDKLLERLQGFQAKASLDDHQAGSGYAFGCRNPLGSAVMGRAAIGHA